jgi:hypothetical protein
VNQKPLKIHEHLAFIAFHLLSQKKSIAGFTWAVDRQNTSSANGIAPASGWLEKETGYGP